MSDLTVSVCIITRNRLASLEYCLGCLAQQTHRPDEIIVVDSSTGSETRDFLKEHYPQARYFHMPAPLGSQPRLRNLALLHAQSDIIAATDDDGFPEAGWLSAILRCYGPGVGAVGGRILQGEPDDGGGRCPSVGRVSLVHGALGNFNAIWSEPFEVDHLQGTNMSFRRELLNQAGGWDLVLEGGYAACEDTETCLRIKRMGYRVIYSPHAVVQHGLAPREGGFTRDLGQSARLAYSVSRNTAYSIFKNYRLVPSVVVGAGIIAPMINVARSLLPRRAGSSRRSVSLSEARLAAAAAVIAGHLAGLMCLIRSRTVDPLPRLRPTGFL